MQTWASTHIGGRKCCSYKFNCKKHSVLHQKFLTFYICLPLLFFLFLFFLPLFSVVIYTTVSIWLSNKVFNKKIPQPTSTWTNVKAYVNNPSFTIRTGCGCQMCRLHDLLKSFKWYLLAGVKKYNIHILSLLKQKLTSRNTVVDCGHSSEGITVIIPNVPI